MFLAFLRPHFNPCYARAKMSLSRVKNIFMPANINSIVILTSLLFKKRPFCLNHFDLSSLMRDRLNKYLVYNFEKTQTLSKILISSDFSIKSQGP